MSKSFIAALVFGFVASVAVVATRAEDAAKPKWDIKQVMKAAHKDGLLKKVVDGNGTAQDAKDLLALYEALAANKPPMGEAADWKAKNDAIVAAAKDVVAGKEGAGKALQAAANCANCHKAHKPPAEK
jgi:hypothetical protein